MITYDIHKVLFSFLFNKTCVMEEDEKIEKTSLLYMSPCFVLFLFTLFFFLWEVKIPICTREMYFKASFGTRKVLRKENSEAKWKENKKIGLNLIN